MFLTLQTLSSDGIGATNVRTVEPSEAREVVRQLVTDILNDGDLMLVRLELRVVEDEP